MRKILSLILLTGLLIGCSGRVAYVSSSEEVVQKRDVVKVDDFCMLRKVCDETCDSIWMDLNTEVLYYRSDTSSGGITPIMKADGTCLTYSEWKKTRKKSE